MTQTTTKHNHPAPPSTVTWPVLEHLTSIIWSCTLAGVPHPVIFPHPEGGVRLVWNTGIRRTEIDILNDDRIVRRTNTGAAGEEHLTALGPDIIAELNRYHR